MPSPPCRVGIELPALPHVNVRLLAEAGHSVVGVDQSARAIAAARGRAPAHLADCMQFVCADFHEAAITGSFDIVAYVDGFGIGRDGDERRLLRRIRDWLVPDGVAIIEVYTP